MTCECGHDKEKHIDGTGRCMAIDWPDVECIDCECKAYKADPEDHCDEETACPAIGVGGLHCDHWYDGQPCCFCGAPAMCEAHQRKQGMID